MAGNSVIGALRVSLGLDSAQFQKGTKDAKSSLDRFASQAKVAFAAVAAAGAAMAGALAVGIRNTINEADKLGYVADRLGVTTESLQELRYAAERSGMAVNNFDVAYRRFIRRSAEAAQGTGAAKAAFEEMGISLRDTTGRLKDSDQLLGEVADALQKVQDPADRLRLAFKLFDTDGAAMVNVLAEGADGLNRYREEARALGIVLSDDAVRGAQAFRSNLDLVWKAKDALFIQLSQHLLPALEKMSEWFLKFVADGDKVRDTADMIVEGFRFVARSAASIIGGIAGIRAELAGLADAASKLFSGDFMGARDAWNEGQETARRIREEMMAAVDGIFDGSVMSQGQIDRRIAAAFAASGEEAGNEFVANFEEATRSRGGGRTAIDEMAREAARIFDQTRTPLEQYQAQIARLNELLQAGAIDQDTYNRAVLQAQDAFDRATQAAEKSLYSLENVGRSIAGTITNAFQGLIDGSRSLGDVLKNLLSQLSSLLMNQAFNALFGFGKGGGGILSTLFGGFRADGGPVRSGRAYLVGERGPELMVPNSSGTVVPNHALSSGGGGNGGTSVLQVELSPDLVGQILQQAADQSISITKKNNNLRMNRYQNGGQFA